MLDVHDWLNDYRDRNVVEGWLDPKAFAFLHLIHRAQMSSPMPSSGGALEIGVHHGKFFIALNALVDNETTKSFAVDVFDDQFLNIDSNGKGNRAQFEKNLQDYDRHGGRNVIIEATDSTLLRANDLIERAGSKFKIISIDGGHTAEHTLSDLRLANSALDSFGFVIVDDISNVHWMGVSAIPSF